MTGKIFILQYASQKKECWLFGLLMLQIPGGSFSNGGLDGWKTGGAKRAILAYP